MYRITRCLLVFSLTLVVVFSANSPYVYADETIQSADNQRVFCSDGGLLLITLQESGNRSLTSTESIRAGSKSFTRKDSSGATLWTATLNAAFEYTGTSALCTSVECPITIYNSSYSVASKSVSKNGNQASCTFTIAHKILGITVSSETHTITLSCDPYGNLY